MTAVRIQRRDERVALAAGILERRDRSAPQPHLAGTMQAPQTQLVRRKLGHPVTRAVGTVVVNHEDVGGGQHLPHASDQVREILPLVVGRQGDQQLVGWGHEVLRIPIE